MTQTTNNLAESTELSVPTPDDYAAISKLKAEAFADKQAEPDGGAEYRRCAKEYPLKVQHSRVARIQGELAGAIQLQLHNDPGDLGFPAPLRHSLQPGEAYVEFIATHAKFRGQGVGSRLLEWAEEFAREQGCKTLTLDVFKANKGAVRLYQRKGFVIQNNGRTNGYCLASCLFCCLSCGKYWHIYFMEKDLNVEEKTENASNPE